MKNGPPFSSRRSSKYPSPYSIPAMAYSRESKENSRNQLHSRPARCVNVTAAKSGEREKWSVCRPNLFPDRLVRVPVLALEFLGQRVDRTVIDLLVTFLLAGGIVRQRELGARGFVRRRDHGIADPQHQFVRRAG